MIMCRHTHFLSPNAHQQTCTSTNMHDLQTHIDKHAQSANTVCKRTSASVCGLQTHLDEHTSTQHSLFNNDKFMVSTVNNLCESTATFPVSSPTNILLTSECAFHSYLVHECTSTLHTFISKEQQAPSHELDMFLSSMTEDVAMFDTTIEGFACDDAKVIEDTNYNVKDKISAKDIAVDDNIFDDVDPIFDDNIYTDPIFADEMSTYTESSNNSKRNIVIDDTFDEVMNVNAIAVNNIKTDLYKVRKAKWGEKMSQTEILELLEDCVDACKVALPSTYKTDAEVLKSNYRNNMLLWPSDGIINTVLLTETTPYISREDAEKSALHLENISDLALRKIMELFTDSQFAGKSHNTLSYGYNMNTTHSAKSDVVGCWNFRMQLAMMLGLPDKCGVLKPFNDNREKWLYMQLYIMSEFRRLRVLNEDHSPVEMYVGNAYTGRSDNSQKCQRYTLTDKRKLFKLTWKLWTLPLLCHLQPQLIIPCSAWVLEALKTEYDELEALSHGVCTVYRGKLFHPSTHLNWPIRAGCSTIKYNLIHRNMSVIEHYQARLDLNQTLFASINPMLTKQTNSLAKQKSRDKKQEIRAKIKTTTALMHKIQKQLGSPEPHECRMDTVEQIRIIKQSMDHVIEIVKQRFLPLCSSDDNILIPLLHDITTSTDIDFTDFDTAVTLLDDSNVSMSQDNIISDHNAIPLYQTTSDVVTSITYDMIYFMCSNVRNNRGNTFLCNVSSVMSTLHDESISGVEIRMRGNRKKYLRLYKCLSQHYTSIDLKSMFIWLISPYARRCVIFGSIKLVQQIPALLCTAEFMLNVPNCRDSGYGVCLFTDLISLK